MRVGKAMADVGWLEFGAALDTAQGGVDHNT